MSRYEVYVQYTNKKTDETYEKTYARFRWFWTASMWADFVRWLLRNEYNVYTYVGPPQKRVQPKRPTTRAESERIVKRRGNSDAGILVVIVLLVLMVLCLGLWGCPKYSVYSAEMSGKAEFARAESNRQIAVREAEAKKDAAKLLADAEIERARGVAESNRIIGEGLKDNEAYLRYLWVSNIGSGDREIIYIPTEANIPIMEAGRATEPKKAKPPAEPAPKR